MTKPVWTAFGEGGTLIGVSDATFTSANAPSAISPQRWIKVTIDGVDGYLPWFSAGTPTGSGGGGGGLSGLDPAQLVYGAGDGTAAQSEQLAFSETEFEDGSFILSVPSFLTLPSAGDDAGYGLNLTTRDRTGDVASSAIYLLSGNTNGSEASGDLSLQTGAASGAGNSGNVTIISGTTSDGTSGAVALNSSASSAGSTGTASLRTGASTAGNSGAISIISGSAAAGVAGTIQVQAGATASGLAGEAQVSGGNASSSGAAGAVTIRGGNAAGAGAGGAVAIIAGTSSAGTPGDIQLTAPSIALTDMDSTGGSNATFTASNAPAAISPKKWVKVIIGGVTGYLAWFST